MSAIANTIPQSRNIPRSVLAIIIGFLAVAALSLGTDQILHVMKVYPPWGVPMWDPALNALALGYRIIYTILGGWLTARLAPRNPMKHAIILGVIGLVPATIGAIVAINGNFGPSWYPIALAIVGLPCTWIGGVLHRRQS